jgi:hypothetical protein
MKRLRVLLTVVALLAASMPAQAARICGLALNAVLPLRTCAMDACPQIIALTENASVTVLRQDGAWTDLQAFSPSNNQPVTGWAPSQNVCEVP